MEGFKKVMQYCPDLATYESAKAAGRITDDVFVVILSERKAMFKGRVFEWGGVDVTLDMIYPVGSIYLSVNNVNPSVLFGGEWERIKDRFLLAAGDTYAAGAAGGSDTVTLTQSQVPRVAGQINFHHAAIATNVSSANGCFSTTVTNNRYKQGGTESSGAVSIGSVVFDNGGKDAAHNNMPPYLAVYIWKRII